MKKQLSLSVLALGVGLLSLHAQLPVSGADEKTASHSEYFSWINNTNEGATAEHTLINLNFFKWMNSTYGMKLDIYAFDAGAIDGAKMYGSTKSARFKSQFPQGFGPISQEAAKIGARLGVWGGPDGFGDTPEEAQERMDMMVGLVRDYNFQLFKMDAVCGQLRPSKYDYFDQMMTKVRQYSPDFVLLNHRLDLGPGTKHSTTFLLGGDETYIDVFMTNDMTAPHHRAKAISRKSPEGLTRLTEDHGVCLSSCLDYWEDDLILQAFGRELILSPEIYANPWLLKDDEFPYLAYIFNLHRDYRDILVDGMKLPEDQYGPEAVSRGNESTRFLALRNLTWNPVKYRIKLDSEVGLTRQGSVKARLYHPYILDLGAHAYGSEIEVEVLPFRAALVKLTTEAEKDKVALSGIPYQIINDRTSDAVELKLLGMPGQKYNVKIERGADALKFAALDQTQANGLLKGKSYPVAFSGKKLQHDYHRQIAVMDACVNVPDDISSVYYATCFAADNNALEARSVLRSGETTVPEVKAARDAFFNQRIFQEREIWDKYLFDNDPATAFSISFRWGDKRQGGESSFYLDLGKPTSLDKLTLDSFDEYSIAPLKSFEGVYAYVSKDLKEWQSITFVAGKHMEIDLSQAGEVRYIRFSPCPIRLSEVTGYKDGKTVERSQWRASNLFHTYGSGKFNAKQVWKSSFTLDEIPQGAYLCVAVNGNHGEEGAWAGFKIDGEYIGCPDRAPSFASNTWEYRNNTGNQNYTYYLPLTEDMKGKQIEAFAMTFGNQSETIKPEVWITAYPIPFESKNLVLR